MGSIYFISPVAYGMNPVFTVVGTFGMVQAWVGHFVSPLKRR
jgi:hypothetical protein